MNILGSPEFLSETDFGLFPGACGGPNRAETVERTVSIIVFSDRGAEMIVIIVTVFNDLILKHSNNALVQNKGGAPQGPEKKERQMF